jgi:biotin carboxyl carrier protein
VGVFLDRHPLRLQPAAPPGAEVQAGEPIGFMRIGALLRVVEAPAHGIVLDALAAHGDVVGYGAPLFAFEPFGSGTEP